MITETDKIFAVENYHSVTYYCNKVLCGRANGILYLCCKNFIYTNLLAASMHFQIVIWDILDIVWNIAVYITFGWKELSADW